MNQSEYRKKIREDFPNVDWNNFIYDACNKRMYRMTCDKCDDDRGYLRARQRHFLCQSCGQKGKISGRKGKKLIPEQKQKISLANKKWRTEKDPNYRKLTGLDKKIIHNIRCRLWLAVNDKPASLSKSIGCATHELRRHLESKFTEGMSWDNYGLKGWEIDHIKPLSSFDLSDSEQFKKACHYSNLQPLWVKDNRSKGQKCDN